MKVFRLVLILALLIVALILIRVSKNAPTTQNEPVAPEPQTTSSIQGCYVARQSKDVYTLKVDKIENNQVSGTLSYQNYQKDSSQGSLDGTYNGEMLVGDYAFRSEGMDSVRQVAFKKTDDGFIQGFGEIQMQDGKERLVDLNNLSYDHSPEYIEEECQ